MTGAVEHIRHRSEVATSMRGQNNESDAKYTGETTGKTTGKIDLVIGRDQWWRALLFLLSMSLMGLKFPLGYLLVPICLISAWRSNKYDFIIQLTFFVGGYAFIVGEYTFPFKTEDVAIGVSLIGVLVYRKPVIVKKALVALGLYALITLFLATFSDESMSVQIRTWRYWFCFIYFIVPLMVFAGRDFQIKELFRRLFPYVFVVCAFYALDAFIINGHILIPNSFVWGGGESTWNNPILYGMGYFPRKYPPGLYWIVLLIIPITRYYKLKPWQWLLLGVAVISTRTFTLILTVVVGLMVFQPKKGRLFGYGIAFVILLSVGYAVDSSLPVNPSNNESMLRIKSSIDQIIDLGEAQDDEDLSEAGSGRFAQAIPKFELLYGYNKQWTGLGYLHPTLTTNTKYIIINEFYTDIERNVEVATGIEIMPLQVFLTVGYLGLIVHFAFFIYMWILVRRLRYSIYFGSVLLLTFILGLSGFSGWVTGMCLFLNALAFAAVLMANRDVLWPKSLNFNKSDDEQTAAYKE